MVKSRRPEEATRGHGVRERGSAPRRRVASPVGATPAGAALLLPMLAMLAMGGCVGESAAAANPVLRVCADPNNLPFSNARHEGFENRLAELLAREMGSELEYTWWAQRRGFIRNTLRAGECDVVIGMPSALEHARPTRPYYRSTYVFVYPRDRGIEISSFDDPVLRELRLGVHVVGDDYASTPPVHALAKRGIVNNVIGYSIFGDYREENPPARILDALEAGEIDVAIVWGPLAGYFAPRSGMDLEIVPVLPQIDLPFLPMVYDVSMGVRWEDTVLVARIDSVLYRTEPEIRRLLEEYGVPRVERAASSRRNE